jgi:hypothetical protein
MSEIKFKHGTTIEGKTINDGDIIMVNNTMGSSNTNEETDGFGSVYKGTKIVGTTKADELRLTENLKVIGTTVGNITNGETLKKGMSIEDVLKMMLQQEIGLTTEAPTKTVSISPTSTQEVGSTVSVTLSASFNDGKIKSSNPDMWAFEQAAGCVAGDIVWKKGTEVVTSPYSFVVAAGSNTFNVEIPYTGVEVTLPNNLGNEETVTIADDIFKDSKTITGSYKYFIGECDLINSEDDITSDLVRGLDKSGFVATSNIPYVVTHNSQKGFIVACPRSLELEYIKDDAAVF